MPTNVLVIAFSSILEAEESTARTSLPEAATSLGPRRWTCGSGRGPIMTITQIHALVGSVRTTLKWFGRIRFGLGALGFSAIVDGGSLLVITIHKATTLGSALSRGIIVSFIRSMHE
ncbi:hypothetical protein RHSIM_Rhsim11G0148200 [Rhododendron simsii]|uniref:Uncharacterized protein n=1 Tax=Rhododendron simsii TaxID=118357 RepID=A0A834GBV6_RHOSS|nr:hypothetical protein RHSIM_Rhsim11G0148200 [Rhododendron simsii]